MEKFSKQASSKNGYRKTCKNCHNKYVREVWYVKNADKQKRAVKEWSERNKAAVLATRYKCSVEEIQALLDRGCCDNCGKTEELHVDHCHSTGKIRGILCRGCNHGLGQFEDSPEKLQGAIEYLARVYGDSTLS